MADSRSKYLFNNTLIFALGNFGTKLISFFLVPIYTYTLSVADYGTADLVTTVSFVLAPMLTLNLSDAVMRFPLDKKGNDNQILTVGVVALVFAHIVGLLMIPMARLSPDVSGFSTLMYLYCVTSATSSMLQAFLRGLERLRQFAFSNILCTAFTAGFNILFLVVFKWGVSGYLLAYVLAFVATSVYSAFASGLFRRIRYLRFDKKLFLEMFKYAIVLMPSTFMWWIINSSSRVIVTAMLGAAANGILAVAYKIPSIISVVANTFTQAWSYSAIREDASDDRDQFTSNVFDKLVLSAGLLTLFLMMVIRPVTLLYVSPDYASAWQYSSWLLLGNYLLTIGNFLGAPYTVHKDSFGYLISTAVGAILNIVLMVMLIPIMGLYGSVVAAFLGYFAVVIFRYFHTKKYVRMTVRWSRFTPMLTAMVLILVLQSFFVPALTVGTLVVALFVLFSYRKLLLQLLRCVKGRLLS
ncbi:MAG: oligosaccharide flippase family protein [Coriobacteriaceae bacterium]|nr:oligosaccharide flippase family protein [Coriobacteriaceae bacterium]